MSVDFAKKLKIADLQAAYAAGNVKVYTSEERDLADFIDGPQKEDVATNIKIFVRIGDAPELLFQAHFLGKRNEKFVHLSDTETMHRNKTNHRRKFIDAIDAEIDHKTFDEEAVEKLFPGVVDKVKSEYFVELDRAWEQLKQIIKTHNDEVAAIAAEEGESFEDFCGLNSHIPQRSL